jgi:hypothetical protein
MRRLALALAAGSVLAASPATALAATPPLGACKDKIVGVTGNKFLILSFTPMSPRIAAQAGARPPKSLG